MNNFDYAVGLTLTEEGVFSDTAGDRGGATKYGITAKLGMAYGHMDIHTITKGDAIRIYRAEFWDKMRLDDLLSKWVAAEIFDTAVNSGSNQAALIAQRAVNLLLRPEQVKLVEDGRFGPGTRAAINNLCATRHRHLLAALNGFQFQFYLDDVKSHPGDVKFIAGWLRRLTWSNDAPERV